MRRRNEKRLPTLQHRETAAIFSSKCTVGDGTDYDDGSVGHSAGGTGIINVISQAKMSGGKRDRHRAKGESIVSE